MRILVHSPCLELCIACRQKLVCEELVVHRGSYYRDSVYIFCTGLFPADKDWNFCNQGEEERKQYQENDITSMFIKE